MKIKVYNPDYTSLFTITGIQLIIICFFVYLIPQDMKKFVLEIFSCLMAILIGITFFYIIVCFFFILLERSRKDKTAINADEYKEAVKEIEKLYTKNKISFRVAVDEIKNLKKRHKKFMENEEKKDKNKLVLKSIACLNEELKQ